MTSATRSRWSSGSAPSGRPEPPAETRPTTGAVPGMKTTRPTLLVVDDEPEVLQSVHDLLRLEYHVLTCESGAAAVREVLRPVQALPRLESPVLPGESGAAAVGVLESPEPVHVVMSDQRMPGMTGVEVLRHARRLRPDATRLVMTAYSDVHAVI